MDYRKSDAPVNTQTRNILDFCKGTDNIYESDNVETCKSNICCYENRLAKEIAGVCFGK